MGKLRIKFVDGYWFCIGPACAAFARTPLWAWRDAMGIPDITRMNLNER